MIEEIPLPGHLVEPGEKFLPLRNGMFHSRLAWKGDDCMDMIGHKQQQPTVPEQVLVIIGCGFEDSIASTRTAEVIVILRLAVNRDEEEAPLSDPFWNLVRETFAHGTFHVPAITAQPS